MTQNSKAKNDFKNQIFTIPNILSMVRICMIPVIMWFYLGIENFRAAGFMLVLSGVTDVVDGFIARRFNMISDVGKVLDPFADKLTQAAILICLMFRYPLMAVPFICTVIKELFMTISGYQVVRKKGIVLGANWHGKAATFLLYITMFIHVVWYDIPAAVSDLSIMLSAGMIVLSLVLYAIRNIKVLNGATV